MGPASFLDPIPDPQCSQLKGIKMHWTLHASPCSRAMVVPCRSYTSSLSMGVSSSSTWMVKENTLPKKKRDSFGVIPWHQLWDLALSQFLSQEVTCVVIVVSVSAHASDLRRAALESHIHGRCSRPTPNSAQGFRDMGSSWLLGSPCRTKMLLRPAGGHTPSISPCLSSFLL